MKSKLIALIFLCVCKSTLAQNNIEHPISKIAVDHVLFLIDKKDSGILNKLQMNGLSPATKWTTPHAGQGTTGKFFFFLNTYLEILIITDTTEASKNSQNFGYNINTRLKDGNSKLGIGLRQMPFKKDSIPFTTHVYKQKWMGKESLYMATENNNLKQPFVFLEPPAFANMVVEKLSDLNQYATANPEMITYRQHPAGLENLTGIEIYTTDKKKDWESHISYLSQFNKVTIKKAKQNFTVMFFDNCKQAKIIDFKSELGLILKY